MKIRRRQMCKIPKATPKKSLLMAIYSQKKKNQKMESLKPLEIFYSECARLRGQPRGFHCGIKSRACFFFVSVFFRSSFFVFATPHAMHNHGESVCTILDWTMETGS